MNGPFVSELRGLGSLIPFAHGFFQTIDLMLDKRSNVPKLEVHS